MQAEGWCVLPLPVVSRPLTQFLWSYSTSTTTPNHFTCMVTSEIGGKEIHSRGSRVGGKRTAACAAVCHAGEVLLSLLCPGLPVLNRLLSALGTCALTAIMCQPRPQLGPFR